MKARVWGGSGWHTCEVDLSAGTCTRAEAEPGLDYLIPGLVDTHCHGLAGLDVMAGDSKAIGERLRDLGVEWVCPTTVTGTWAEIRQAIDAIGSGFDEFAGVHLEGPFIAEKMAGAQPRDAIVPCSVSTLTTELGHRVRMLKYVTLAPELPGALELVRWLASERIVPSCGHSDATAADLLAAREAGLDRMTHFYNAMSGLHHRESGCVGFGLSHAPKCELIYDGHHVSKDAAAILIKCVGVTRVIGVSDGTLLSAMPDGTEAAMWGHDVVRADGKAQSKDGMLCGSCATLVDVFQNLWADFGPEVATFACCLNPREELGLGEAGVWLVVRSTGEVKDVLSGNLDCQPV